MDSRTEEQIRVPGKQLREILNTHFNSLGYGDIKDYTLVHNKGKVVEFLLIVEKKTLMEEVLKFTKISNLRFSTSSYRERILNCLKSHDIENLEQFQQAILEGGIHKGKFRISKTQKTLTLKVRNFGKKSVTAFLDALKQSGLEITEEGKIVEVKI